MEVVPSDCNATILIVTTDGYGKRTRMSDYRVQSRGGVGIITQKVTDKVGNVVGARLVSNDQQMILTTDKGQNIRMKISDISILGRNTQGVKLINLKSGEKVTGMALLEEDDDKE